MTPLRKRWIDHLTERPKARTVQIAEALGVTEAELLHARVGDDAIQLRPDWKELLTGLPALGPVMSLARNAHVVHESTGPFERVAYRPFMVGVYGDHIDQRLIIGRWALAIAAPVETRRGTLDSLQIFDDTGTAVLKIYARDATDRAAWAALVERLRDPEPSLPSFAPAPPAPEVADEDVDADGLRDAWAKMTDTHQVHPLLHRLKVAREQALRLLGPEWAMPVDPIALTRILEGCAEDEEPLMVFVGNRGAIQIYSGSVHRIVPMDTWINVMDPTFNLHADRSGLARAWVVRKPTDRGFVLSLEVFGSDGTLLVQLFGKRTEAQSQRPSWHVRLETIAQQHPALDRVVGEA